MTTYNKPPGPGETLNRNHNYPGPHALRRIIERRYPHLRFNGIFARRPVAGTNTPSAHQVARGVDFSQDNATAKAEAENCFWWLISIADKIGLQGVIFDHKIWGFGNERVRPTHRDGNPHTDHIHFEQNIAGAKLSEQEIINRLGGDDMAEVTKAQLDAVHDDITNQLNRFRDVQIPAIDKAIADARKEIADLSAGGGQVDLDALANKVADKLSERLKS